jgi:hypothetical protein
MTFLIVMRRYYSYVSIQLNPRDGKLQAHGMKSYCKSHIDVREKDYVEECDLCS